MHSVLCKSFGPPSVRKSAALDNLLHSLTNHPILLYACGGLRNPYQKLPTDANKRLEPTHIFRANISFHLFCRPKVTFLAYYYPIYYLSLVSECFLHPIFHCCHLILSSLSQHFFSLLKKSTINIFIVQK